MPQIGEGERIFLEAGARQSARADGRGALDLRHLVLRKGVVDFANGSALLERAFTSAQVLACVKLEVVDLEDSRNAGNEDVHFDVSVDCTAIEAREEDASLRKLRDYARYLGEMLEEQLQEMVSGQGHLLEVIPGKFSWMVNLDVVVLGTDGNLPDLISLAAYAALCDARMPSIEIMDSEGGTKDFQVDSDPQGAKPLPRQLLDSVPIRVSLFRIAETMLVDVSEDEDLCSSLAMSVLVNRRGSLCGSHIDRAGCIPLVEVGAHLATACQIGAELFKLLDANL
ncbi:Exosome complex component RRP42 [Hondaea fermentalgiana]|uniref:Ribosomal RNA-processing protein 42 n=1 Tax=Hondaea fermentalgiana TaxID=2315210 RepID=A0A2R5H0T4_9STRA|nr:Exosome complex component RRP42 [Hondaea fermentalgiana]|eukprot:GBG34673.1 Exosome complex component RRP42 [Hondaea fermentalgiana]